MKRKIIVTSDGSSTLYLPDLNEHYHSTNGAIQEAYHVYIKKGLHTIKSNEVTVLEIGFGTGLNCFISFLEAANKVIHYVGVEAYPVTLDEVAQLNYVTELKASKEKAVFNKMHSVAWEEAHQLAANFWLTKRQQFFKDICYEACFDIIYFDAFGPEKQPDLWTEAIFKKMYEALKPNGLLVTYASKGLVKRAMRSVGFKVKRLPGPPGKWHMLQAVKEG